MSSETKVDPRIKAQRRYDKRRTGLVTSVRWSSPEERDKVEAALCRPGESLGPALKRLALENS